MAHAANHAAVTLWRLVGSGTVMVAGSLAEHWRRKLARVLSQLAQQELELAHLSEALDAMNRAQRDLALCVTHPSRFNTRRDRSKYPIRYPSQAMRPIHSANLCHAQV